MSAGGQSTTWPCCPGMTTSPPQPDIRQARRRGLDLTDRITEGIEAERRRRCAAPITRARPERARPSSISCRQKFWCPWRESNPHSLRNTILSRARLPVPPHGHKAHSISSVGAAVHRTARPLGHAAQYPLIASQEADDEVRLLEGVGSKHDGFAHTSRHMSKFQSNTWCFTVLGRERRVDITREIMASG